VRSIPSHVATVREHVIDPLTHEQVGQLTRITEAILARLGPHGKMAAIYERYDRTPQGAAGDKGATR
jgi:hypothetical protein